MSSEPPFRPPHFRWVDRPPVPSRVYRVVGRSGDEQIMEDVPVRPPDPGPDELWNRPTRIAVWSLLLIVLLGGIVGLMYTVTH